MLWAGISSQSLQGSLASEVVLTFESVHKILCCDHSNDTFWAVVSHDTKNLFFSILQFSKEIWKFCWMLTLTTFGSAWPGKTWTTFMGAKKTLIRNFNWNITCAMPYEYSHHAGHCPPPYPPHCFYWGTLCIDGWSVINNRVFYNLRVFSSSASEGTKHTYKVQKYEKTDHHSTSLAWCT